MTRQGPFSFLEKMSFYSTGDELALVQAAQQTHWERTACVIEDHATTISAACRHHMQETGCTYEEAASTFLRKCDQFLTIQYVIDAHRAELENTKTDQ